MAALEQVRALFTYARRDRMDVLRWKLACGKRLINHAFRTRHGWIKRYWLFMRIATHSHVHLLKDAFWLLKAPFLRKIVFPAPPTGMLGNQHRYRLQFISSMFSRRFEPPVRADGIELSDEWIGNAFMGLMGSTMCLTNIGKREWKWNYFRDLQ